MRINVSGMLFDAFPLAETTPGGYSQLESISLECLLFLCSDVLLSAV